MKSRATQHTAKIMILGCVEGIGMEMVVLLRCLLRGYNLIIHSFTTMRIRMGCSATTAAAMVMLHFIHS